MRTCKQKAKTQKPPKSGKNPNIFDKMSVKLSGLDKPHVLRKTNNLQGDFQKNYQKHPLVTHRKERRRG